ncbi:TPA: hypothetical protein DCZ39_07975 [Patescibacteria group bacterium]|nr:hypothetical protein [Candidatus Gracilibacteria bacterium]
MQAIQQLIDNKFTHFATMPFGPGNDNMHITGSMTYPDYPDYVVKTNIFLQDDLDVLLAKKMKEQPVARSFFAKLTNTSSDTLVLSTGEIQQLKKVYLFKNEKDLKDLGYVVSSYRTRINNDVDWRKNNISISYRNIGNVRVLNTQQQLSFMDEVHYDPAIKWKRDTVSGLAIM